MATTVWAEVCFERTMCSAVRRRMLVKGTTVSCWPATCAGTSGWLAASRSVGAGDAWPGRRLSFGSRRSGRLGRVRGRCGRRPAVALRRAALAIDERQDVGPGDPAAGTGAVDAGSGRARARRSAGARRGKAPCWSRRRHLAGWEAGRRPAWYRHRRQGRPMPGAARRQPASREQAPRRGHRYRSARRRRQRRRSHRPKARPAQTTPKAQTTPTASRLRRLRGRLRRVSGLRRRVLGSVRLAFTGGRIGRDHRQPGAHVDGVALRYEDLGEVRRRPARGPPSPPCRSRPRTGPRPRRPRRRPASAIG